MSEARLLACEECEEFVDIDKVRYPSKYDEDEFDMHEFAANEYNAHKLKNMLRFMEEHTGCRIVLLGEYGGSQKWWQKASREYEHKEYYPWRQSE